METQYKPKDKGLSQEEYSLKPCEIINIAEEKLKRKSFIIAKGTLDTMVDKIDQTF